MGTVILLSSSPPRSFALSPTPAASSSPALASPSSIFGDGHKRFKITTIHRDGFTGGFSTARCILGTKVGSENLPFGVTKSLRISGKNLKEPSSTSEGAVPQLEDGGRPKAKRSKSLATARNLEDGQRKRDKTPLVGTDESIEAGVGSPSVTEADVRPKNQALSPLLLDKALSRRLDWTPPGRHSLNGVGLDPDASQSTAILPGGLLGSFGYKGGSAQSNFNPRSNDEGAPTKRQKLDFIDHVSLQASKVKAVPKLAPDINNSAAAPAKRSKNPKKKSTTITALATSKYFDENNVEEASMPMLQYLAATQARDIGSTEEPSPDTPKGKRARKMPRAKKKSVSQSVLLSPESALKAIGRQDMLFGSASQLARDESPAFIRDTVEATRQSESSIACTPVPTQITIPSELGSATSRELEGTFRFTKSRNLWASASRDEDNALLQVETIDLFDSPDLRLAFTGKDAMLEPTAPRYRESVSPEKTLPLLRGGHLRRSAFAESNDWLDIDNIGILTPGAHVTKFFMQTRTLHTTLEPPGERAKSPLGTDEVRGKGAKGDSLTNETEVPADSSVSVGAGHSIDPSKPQMPIFSGFTTAELSNQIKKYGFKSFRKRERMIEVLQSCWEAKHKLDASSTNKLTAKNAQDEEVEVATHGDILSKVHGLAARPMPKIPKPKVPRSKKEKSETPAKPTRRKPAAKAEKDVEKTPKPRKKAEPKTKKSAGSTTEKAKLPGKRRVKTTALSEEYIIDISDIEDSIVEGDEKTPMPVAMARLKDARDTALQSTTRLATPPAMLPLNISSESMVPRPLENAIPDSSDINMQITVAIKKYVPAPTRDHQRDPTWHEKILMYDPIVLEDLAAWLNTEGLALIGEDREVSALEVRTWCEMKGVCCYGVGGGWRGNVKGRAQAKGNEVED